MDKIYRMGNIPAVWILRFGYRPVLGEFRLTDETVEAWNRIRQNWSKMSRSKPIENGRNGWYLLFWPVFGLRYLLIENCHPAAAFHSVYCALDDRIPFLEGFIIPYLLWHWCIIGIHLWLFIRKDPVFRHYSRYLVVSMSISTAVFLLFPTCQNLRPAAFPRENFLTDTVRMLYQMDTSTNVCPSEHVIGSVGFFLAAAYSRKLRSPQKMAGFAVLAFLTAAATVFLKQHSVVDVAAALPVCAVGWYIGFHRCSAEKASGTDRRFYKRLDTC